LSRYKKPALSAGVHDCACRAPCGCLINAINALLLLACAMGIDLLLPCIDSAMRAVNSNVDDSRDQASGIPAPGAGWDNLRGWPKIPTLSGMEHLPTGAETVN